MNLQIRIDRNESVRTGFRILRRKLKEKNIYILNRDYYIENIKSRGTVITCHSDGIVTSL